MPLEPLIRLVDLSKVYRPQGKQDASLGVRALDHINLDIYPGEYVSIVGPSGSGKSTMMQVLGLLDRPTDGKLILAGQDVSKLNDDQLAMLRNQSIGFIFQFFNLLARTTAMDNVALPLIYSRKADPKERAKKMLEFVGMKDRMYHAPHQLSGGQQQRVAIARALANEPVLLFADEPTGNISSQQSNEVMAELDSLNQAGVTVVLVTHEPDVAEHARRMLTMKDGHVISDKQIKPERFAEKAQNRTDAFRVKPMSALPSMASIFENLRMALIALSLNKFRTFLTMLGMILAVVAVIAVTAIGNGMQVTTKARLASLGSNLVMLRPGNANTRGVGSAPRFQMQDVDKLRQLTLIGGAVRQVDPTVQGGVLVSYGDNDWSTEATGAEPAYAEMRNAMPVAGRFFTAEENQERARVCLLGKTVIQNLYPDGFDPTGTQVQINKTNFTVIGVLPVKGSNGFSDQDDTVLMPLQTAMWRVFGVTDLNSVDVEAVDSDDVQACIDEVTQLCRTIRHIQPGQPDDFMVRNMADIQQAQQDIAKTLQETLLVIALVSLIVGGIGIMNIMLVSVKERTKEIGLRKALGARNVEVLFQFLVEALLICLIGGGIGIFMGVVFSFVLNHIGWLAIISWMTVFVAVLVSAGSGVVFGLWPAMQAAKLSPIEALRYE
ncbi:MAG TPA: ABC transporter permease [bacterium]|jgi:macrolide transport system ATP-binding/permease protein|nr:ABC transporter permease [bacterium]